MFFKINSFYRRFSYFSLRLLGKKFISTNVNSFQLASNSPLRASKARKFNNLKGVPSPFGIEQRQRQGHLKLINKRRYSTTNPEGIVTSTSLSLRSTKTPPLEKQHSINESLNLMFPLLTGEELKAFDSSVYEC